MKLLIILSAMSAGLYAMDHSRSMEFRQDGFEAAQAMYESCIDEAAETHDEAERDSDAKYISECFVELNKQEATGYDL